MGQEFQGFRQFLGSRRFLGFRRFLGSRRFLVLHTLLRLQHKSFRGQYMRQGR